MTPGSFSVPEINCEFLGLFHHSYSELTHLSISNGLNKNKGGLIITIYYGYKILPLSVHKELLLK